MFQVQHVAFFLGGFAVYMLLMVLFGTFMSRGKTKGRNFFTGGAKLPFFLIFSTIGATLIGTGSSIGATANGFRIGWGASAFGLGAFLGLLLIGYVVKKSKPRAKGFLTMAEEAQFLYDGNMMIKRIVAIMMYVISIVWLGNHINGGGTLLAFVTGMDLNLARAIAAVCFVAYVFIAGYLALVWTDVVQLGLLIVGFIVIVLLVIPMAGGWGQITHTIEAAGNAGNLTFYGVGTTGIVPFLTLVFTIGLPILATPTYRMRIYTSHDDLTARKSFNVSAILMLSFSLLPALIGMAAFTIATNNNVTGVLESPDFAFAFVATHVLGPILGLFFLIVGLTATISSGDSDAIAGATIVVQDLYPIFTGKELPEKKVPNFTRLFLFITVVLAYITTLGATDIMAYIRNIIGAVVPGTAIAMFLGAMWKRVTWQGGVAAILGGTGFGVLFLGVPAFNAFIISFLGGPAIGSALVALTGGVCVSLLTKKTYLTEDEKMEIVLANRGKKELASAKSSGD